MQLTLLGIILVLLVVWLYVRYRDQSEEAPKPASLSDTGKTAFHAVSIKFESNACAAAKEMEGRRFLARAAPRLPLPECNSLECRCRFVHHADRRSPKDRRSPFAAAGTHGGTGKFETERRARRDRRKNTDFDEF